MRNKGEGFTSSMISWTSRKLSSLIPSTNYLSSPSSIPESDAAFEDLKKLERTMKRIQAIAMDTEQRGIKNQVEKLRLEELKEVGYDADDVVDEYEFEVLSAKIRDGIQIGGNDYKRKREEEVNHGTPSQLIVPVRGELAIRVKKIRERVDEIISEWEALQWSEGETLRYDVDVVKLPQSTCLVHEPSIHGRNEEKEKIIKSLISDDNNYNGAGSLSILSLVGMGGIGKTTLAQLVYNDPRVCEYFELKAWVCVSENFSVETLTRNIIVSFTNKTCDFTVLNDLQRTLVDEVKGKRFLIVLDDVWNERASLWHSLKTPLIGNSFGKIIVTTRNENVARNMQTMPSYVLTYLPFQYCWSLFKQVAYEYQDPNSNPDLLEIGREIVGKCGGLPLAVKAVGGLLRFEFDEENWREILDSEIWEMEMRNNDVLPALKISYDRLPIHLKQCFVFLSLFPKDYVIHEHDIVSLWLSLGLIRPEGRKPIEDIGVGYVSELLERSMLQLTPSDELERYFIMHDLINDLAQSVSGKEFSRIQPDILHKLPGEVRYISIISHNSTDIVDLQYLNHLRAPRLLQVVNAMNNRDSIINILPELFHMLKHLRALDFSSSGIEILPDSIGNSRQLRYINVRNTKIRKLPDSICGLYNLQTIELQRSFIYELPIRVSSLVNLQHLRLNSGTCIPRGIGQLLNLKALTNFIINPGTWHCALSELKNLVYLKEHLCIHGLEHLTNVRDAEEATLWNKKFLRKLSLNWYSYGSCNHSNYWGNIDVNIKLTEQVLGALQPHANIEELYICSYAGYSYPSWLGDALFSKLVKFTLRFFANCKYLPTLGQLPSLREISIYSMESIENVGREFYSHDSKMVGFRSLKKLEFEIMPKWVNWSGVETGDFCSLQTLRLISCYKLQTIPHLICSTLSTLNVHRCRNLTTPQLLPSLSCLMMSSYISEAFFDDLCLPLLKTLYLSSLLSINSLVLTSQNLPSIEVIKIMDCDDLENVVGLSSLNSLKDLWLLRCRHLQIALDERLPHGLQLLRVAGCPQLHEWEQLQIRRN